MSKNMELNLLVMSGVLYGGLHFNSLLEKTFPTQFEGVLPTSKGLKSDLIFSFGMTGSAYVILKAVEFLR